MVVHTASGLGTRVLSTPTRNRIWARHRAIASWRWIPCSCLVSNLEGEEDGGYEFEWGTSTS